MMIYLLKVIACSAILLGFYLLLFENEKSHNLKRFYLLFCLAFSVVVPFITFETEAEIVSTLPTTYFQGEAQNLTTVNDSAINRAEHFKTINLLYLAYGLVALYFLFKFSKSLYLIITKIRGNEQVKIQNFTAVLLTNPTIPHSFLNYVFLSKADYLNNNIEKEILKHEQTHVQQYHSLDILFIEILKVIFWFNPFLILYKKAIQTNHEYLADESVLQTYTNIAAYQTILFQKISKAQIPTLISSFNYLTTKKRLLMMTRTTSKKVALCKQFAIVPLIAFAVFLFSTRTAAQEPVKKATAQTQKTERFAASADGISENDFKAYQAIEDKYFALRNKKNMHIDLDQATINRLEEMYKRMNDKQQKAARIFFIPRPKPSTKEAPSSTQLSVWQDSKKYTVWVDGKRIQNAKLTGYQSSDFSLWSEGKIRNLAVNDGKPYVVQLTTNSAYQVYYDKIMSSQKSAMLIQLKDGIMWRR